MSRLLIIEDDIHLANLLSMSLQSSEYKTLTASTASEARELINKEHFDMVILNVGLPDGNGYDLCEMIKSNGNSTPVIFLSSHTDEASVVKAIAKGADDYVRKPFGIEELKARINKLLNKMPLPDTTISLGELKINPSQRIVSLLDKMANLGKKELEILVLLTKKAPELVTRETILDLIYEEADLYDRTVDSHISHLRKKLRKIAGPSVQINSVYGLGYRLELKQISGN